MKRIKTVITYRVPDWCFCNCSNFGRPTKELCRFCVKHGRDYVCVLHNMPLDIQEGFLVKKDEECVRATAGFKSEVPDVVQADPKLVMRTTMQEYRKVYRQLIMQGYTDIMADKIAQQTIMGGI